MHNSGFTSYEWQKENKIVKNDISEQLLSRFGSNFPVSVSKSGLLLVNQFCLLNARSRFFLVFSCEFYNRTE